MKTPRLDRQVAAEGHHSLDRRQFLRGLGVCMALPALESLLPRRLVAATLPTVTGVPGLGAATTATGAPLRMAFLSFPNGAIPSKWWPTGEGRKFELNDTMKALGNVKDKLQIIGGLSDHSADPGGDGGGDHARSGGTFLTAVRCKKTEGADFQAGISVDQVAAKQVGHLTPFPSLQISCDTVQNAGTCDKGYVCTYQHNLSWSSPTTPLSPETNPRFLFERLFGAGGTPAERQQNLAMRQTQQSSVLDFVTSETRSLGRQVSARDHQKLDEFLTSVREIEQRIQRAETAKDQHPDPGILTPAGVPVSFTEYVRLNLDMMYLAFLADNTRVVSFIFKGDGNNSDFAEIGVNEGHHYCTHHRNDAALIAKTCVIDKFYATQFAYFLEKMEAARDVDGNSLLHNSMIMYGGGIADGDKHTHDNLPIILAGAGGGTLTPGRYVKRDDDIPIANMYLSMLDRMGVPHVDRFGDSTGRLADL
jgi:BMFP domain-containing protein YqiC